MYIAASCSSNTANTSNNTEESTHQTITYIKDFDTVYSNEQYPTIIELYKDVQPEYTSGIEHE